MTLTQCFVKIISSQSQSNMWVSLNEQTLKLKREHEGFWPWRQKNGSQVFHLNLHSWRIWRWKKRKVVKINMQFLLSSLEAPLLIWISCCEPTWRHISKNNAQELYLDCTCYPWHVQGSCLSGVHRCVDRWNLPPLFRQKPQTAFALPCFN